MKLGQSDAILPAHMLFLRPPCPSLNPNLLGHGHRLAPAPINAHVTPVWAGIDCSPPWLLSDAVTTLTRLGRQ